MKSSSKLFPVRLMSAETSGGIEEDVYLLKPNNSPDKSVEISITHYMVVEPPRHSKSFAPQPVILFHGCYQNRWLWSPREKEGLAHFLTERGFDVWLLEARGHGLSPSNLAFEDNTVATYATYDIPAASAFVTEQTGFSPLWFGYGEGGGCVLLSLAAESIKSVSVAGVILLGPPFERSWWLKLPFASMLRGLFIRRLSKKLSIGPEPEPAALRRQLLREQGLFNHRGQALGIKLWKALEDIPVPMALLVDRSQVFALERGLRRLKKAARMHMLVQNLPRKSLRPVNVQTTLTDNSELEALWITLGGWLAEQGLGCEVLSPGSSTSVA